jgi:hypothetical protein
MRVNTHMHTTGLRLELDHFPLHYHNILPSYTFLILLVRILSVFYVGVFPRDFLSETL